jgi:hypothetical protein
LAAVFLAELPLTNLGLLKHRDMLGARSYPHCLRLPETKSVYWTTGPPCGVAFVSDQDLLLDAIEDAPRILVEHIESDSRRNPEATINMLLFLLDRPDVVAAIERLRVVK